MCEGFRRYFKATLLIVLVTLRHDISPALISEKSIVENRKIKWWIRKTSTPHIVYYSRRNDGPTLCITRPDPHILLSRGISAEY
jgi:hypothetical protein